MTTYESKFEMLQQVVLAGDIRALVTAIQFRPNADPIIKVEWFAQGQLNSAWFDEAQLIIFMGGCDESR